MMNLKKAFEIIGLLANGIDPGTGEKAPAAIFDNPDVIRALNMAFNIMGTKISKQGSGHNIESPSRQGQPWEKDEEDKLIHSFTIDKKEVKEIAKLHERSKGSIRARLKKLKLID